VAELNELTTDKRRVFVEEYLRCWNGTEAARRAGYAWPRREASRLLSNVDIREIVEERIREKAMSADEVLAHLADIARFDAGLLFGKAGIIDWDKARERGITRFVKKMEWAPGGLKVELYDKMDALELIGKHQAMWVERQEFSGPDGGAIDIHDSRFDAALEKVYDQGEGEDT